MSPARPLIGCVPALLFVLLATLVALGCGPVPGTDGGEGAEKAHPDRNRFSVRSVAMRRGPPVLLRVDTATGETWRMGLMEDAAWLAMRETPGAEPEPGDPERYDVRAISLRRGAPTLLRTDTVTGRSWRKGISSGGPWVAITSETAPEPPPEVGLPEAGEPTDADPPIDDAELVEPEEAGADSAPEDSGA